MVKALPEPANNILRSITAASGRSSLNKSLHSLDVLGEALDGKAISIAVVAVPDEGNTDLEVSIAARDDIVDNCLEGLLCSVDP